MVVTAAYVSAYGLLLLVFSMWLKEVYNNCVLKDNTLSSSFFNKITLAVAPVRTES